MALQDQLGKMIGPLPMGAWLAVLAGGLGFALYYRNQQANAVPDVPMDNTTTDSGTSIPAGYGYMGSDTTQPSAPTYADDDAWGVAALARLTAMGLDPLASSAAVSKYLSGERLNAQESELIRQAIRAIGSPPSVPVTPTPVPVTPHAPATWKGANSGPGPVNAWYENTVAVHAYDQNGRATGIVRPKGYDIKIYQWGKIGSVTYGRSVTYYYPASSLKVKTAPKPHKPAPKPIVHKPAHKTPPAKHQQPKAPAKPKIRTYVVKRGDTLSGIAAHYHISWRSIANANKNKIKNPNHIEPGWLLIIPNS